MSALELRLLSRVREVPREAWDALALQADSPFVEHTWLDCLEEAGSVGDARENGWIPRHFAIYRGRDLIAFAPAYVKLNSEGEFVYDWSWADLSQRIGVPYYPKLVFAIPFTPATGEKLVCAPGEDRAELVRIVAHAARGLAKEAGLSGVHTLFPREAEAREWHEAGMLARYAVQFHWSNAGYKTFDDFLATMNAKKRHQLKRECAQPAKSGMTIETLPARADALTPVALTMHDLYASTVDKFFYGRRYLNPRFFALVAERFAERLAWVVAKKDGAIVAGAFNVKKKDALYGRYWGVVPEATDEPFLHFNVCYYHGIRECIAEGLRVFEPGAGGEHKRVRGFMPTITHSAHWLADAKMSRILEAHLARERAAIEEHVGSDGERG